MAPDGRCVDRRSSEELEWLLGDRRWQTIAGPYAAAAVPQLLKRSFNQLHRWALWLAVRLQGRLQMPAPATSLVAEASRTIACCGSAAAFA